MYIFFVGLVSSLFFSSIRVFPLFLPGSFIPSHPFYFPSFVFLGFCFAHSYHWPLFSLPFVSFFHASHRVIIFASPDSCFLPPSSPAPHASYTSPASLHYVHFLGLVLSTPLHVLHLSHFISALLSLIASHPHHVLSFLCIFVRFPLAFAHYFLSLVSSVLPFVPHSSPFISALLLFITSHLHHVLSILCTYIFVFPPCICRLFLMKYYAIILSLSHPFSSTWLPKCPLLTCRLYLPMYSFRLIQLHCFGLRP